MQQLVTSLQQCHEALRRNDLKEFLERTSCQQAWCEQLRALGFSARLGPEHMPETDVRISTLYAQLRHLSDVHAAVLRRMRRTLNIKSMFLAAGDATYPSPACLASLGRK